MAAGRFLTKQQAVKISSTQVAVRYGVGDSVPSSPTSCPFPPDSRHPENYRFSEEVFAQEKRLFLHLKMRTNSL